MSPQQPSSKRVRTARLPRFISHAALGCVISLAGGGVAQATPANGTVDLLTTPPELTTGVSPNVVLTFDDSGSMGRNYMPDSRPYGGSGWGATDQQNTTGDASYPSGGRPFLCAGVIDPNVTDPADPRSWAMNGVYYNPNATYDPPLQVDGVTEFPDATFTAAWDNGIVRNRPDSPGASSTRNLGTGTRFCGNAAGYYRYTGPALTLDANGNISNTAALWNTGNWAWVALPTAQRQNFANWYSYYHTRYMASVTAVSRAYAKFDRNLRTAWQNINNRTLAASTAIYAFEDVPAVYNTRTEFYKWLFSTPVGGNTPNQAAANRVGQFFQRDTGAVDGNPYWDRTLDRELSCRKNFHIQMTDGLWNNATVTTGTNDNTPAPRTLPDGRIYSKDDDESTIFWNESGPNNRSMADIAFHYWATDLRPDFQLDGLTRLKVRPYITDRSTDLFGVPIGVDDPDNPDDNPTLDNKEVYWNPANDPASWPHLVQFMIGFGVSGTIQKSDENLRRLREGDILWPTTVLGTDDGRKIDDMWHAALNSRGKFFAASNPGELIRALQEIIASVIAQSTSSTPASLSLPLLTFGTSGYAAGYDSSDWAGKLVKEEVDPDTGEAGADAGWDAGCMLTGGTFDPVSRVCSAPAGAPWGSGFAPSARDPATRRIVTSTVDALGNPDGIPFRWASVSADDALENGLNQRPLATDRCNPAGTAAEIAACDAFGQQRLDYVRGMRTNESTANPRFRTRSSVLGAIVNARPLYTSSPRGGYYDTFPCDTSDMDDRSSCSPETKARLEAEENGYAAYQFGQRERLPHVYVGANDGMLHAFDAETGAESWAYVPSTLIKNRRLARSTADTAGLTTGVDSAPREADVFIGDRWRTVLVGSLRLGGRGIYAIDVSDIPAASATEDDIAGRIMWEFDSGNVASTDGDAPCATGVRSCASLGYTYDSINVARIHFENRWVALVASGYFPEQEQDAANPADAHEAAAKRTSLLVIDVETGTLIREIRTSTAPQALPAGFRTYGLSTPVVYDVGSDQIDDLAYAGDLGGNLWRFDLSDADPANWKVDLMFASYGNGGAANVGEQPIVFNPTALRDPVTRRPILVFGTGKYLGRDDRTSAIPQQAFYGVRDYGTAASAYPIRVDQLITQQLDQAAANAQGDAVREITGWTPPAGTVPSGTPAMQLGSVDGDGNPIIVKQAAHGWRMPLDIALEPGERAERRAVPLFSINVAVLYSLIPKSDDPCDPGRRYGIAAIDAATGGTVFVGSEGYAPGTGTVGVATKAEVPPGDPVQKRGGGEGSLIIPGLPQDIQDKINEAASLPPWHRGAWRELLDIL
jgi:type IV pilus assembly protein PilY1